jgi:D-alanine transaminase
VLTLCRQEGIVSREALITESEFRRAEEVFLTGTTTEVLPVVQIDGRPVAMGDVGVLTQKLQKIYLAETQHARV